MTPIRCSRSPTCRHGPPPTPSGARRCEVPDTNHYTIAWGAHGAAAVADAIAAAVAPA